VFLVGWKFHGKRFFRALQNLSNLITMSQLSAHSTAVEMNGQKSSNGVSRGQISARNLHENPFSVIDPTDPETASRANRACFGWIEEDDKALFFIPYDHSIRQFCISAIEHRFFTPIILFHIILNTIIILVSESNIRASISTSFYNGMDAYFCIIYGIEVFLKVLARGFCWCGEKSYLRDRWNALDLFVWVFSYVFVHPCFSKCNQSDYAQSHFIHLNLVAVFELLTIILLHSPCGPCLYQSAEFIC
jgi:hypothetical protein